MSNNITPITPKVTRKKWAKKFGYMLLVTVLVIGALLLVVFRDQLSIDRLRRAVTYLDTTGSDDAFAYESDNANRYAALGDGAAVVGTAGVELFDASGTSVYDENVTLPTPGLSTGGGTAAAYDLGGTTLIAVSEKKGELLNTTMEGDILDADVGSGGALCCITSATGYKSLLSVWDANMTATYRWYSASSFLTVCAMAPDGEHAAAISATREDGAYASRLEFFSTSADAPEADLTLGEDAIYDVRYLDSDTVCAFGGTAAYFASAGSESAASVSYDGQYLADYSAGGDGFAALALNQYQAGNHYTLVTVGADGKELARLSLEKQLLSISASGRYLAVLTTDGLTIYTKELKTYAQTDDIVSATHVLMRSDGSALLLGSSQGTIFLP